MKIVYCIPATYNSGGMERVLAKKANYLADVLGWDVTIVTTCQKSRKPFYRFSDSIRMIDLAIDYESMMQMPIVKRIGARWKAKVEHKRKLEQTLMHLKADIVVSMFTHEISFLPSIADGSKKVLELHFSKNFRSLDAKSNGVSPLFRAINHALDWLDRGHIKDYDKFVVLTHRDASDWGKSYANLAVIPNPTTFELPDIADYNRKRTLAIGRVCPQKGFDLLLRAWAMLPAEIRCYWGLDIVGDGPDRERLCQLVAELGLTDSVKLLPPTSNVKSLYLSHSIFCFPSRYEGFSLALMEAMSFGLPPVAFDCPCGPSEIISNGENGYLVENENVLCFASKLRTLVENVDIRQELGKKAKQDVLGNFSEKNIMNKWITLFKTITDQ